MSKVLILDTNYEKIIEDVEKIFREFNFDFKGKKVFLKPNILSAFPPEKGVTTHPKIVEAVVRYLLREGADVVVGDNSGMPRAYGKNENAAKVSGIYAASLGKYANIGERGSLVKIGLENCPTVTVAQAVLDCDIFISLPKFKTHLNTIITGAIKNSYGLVVGAEKTKMHRLFPNYDKFAKVIIEVFKIRKPDLVIMDAVMGMEGDGPNSPDLRNINKVIASTDAVAVDAVMCYMMGADPALVNTLKIAAEENLGQSDISKIEVNGKLEKIKDFKLPSTYGRSGLKDSFVNALIGDITGRGRLEISRKKCVLCRQCQEICPIKAVKDDEYNRYLFIDQEKCIKCFCCKEICPHNAIKVKGLYGIVQKILK